MKRSRTAERRAQRQRWYEADKKAHGQRVKVNCPECGGVEGIPAAPFLVGVETDDEKFHVTKLLRSGQQGFVCANPKCAYQGVVRGQQLNESVRQTEVNRRTRQAGTL